jgi:5-methylcytosine-specific restriction endonuclease McrA
VSDRYISEALKKRVRESAGNRCGYCQSSQKYVLGILEIEHITPVAAGGNSDENNLWLSCRLCNGYKGSQINAIDPLVNRQLSYSIRAIKNGQSNFLGLRMVLVL